MERDILKDLITWKNNRKRKPLLLTGVRQCGKTHVLKEFGNKYFENTAYFNFERNERIGEVFERDLSPSRIIDELGTVLLGRKIEAGKTLLILDEIQVCPRAITSLKYFCEEMPELHVAAAGSLLGVVLKTQELSFPVGKVNRLKLRPMSFSEFARANGLGNILDRLRENPPKEELFSIYSDPLEDAYRHYLAIGGMPAAVAEWVETHDLDAVEEIQDEILRDYENDFSKHAPPSDIPKLHAIWDSLPKQLAKDNHKFLFSHVKEGARAKDLENALEWLAAADLVHKLELVSSPNLPLSAYSDATYFKLYMCDVGLLRRKANVPTSAVLSGAAEYKMFMGAVTENFVMTELKALDLPAWFWRSGNSAELDFITEYEGKIVPIEVKSAENTRAKSLGLFISRYSSKKAVCLSLKNFGINEGESTIKYSIPLYLSFLLREYIK